MIVVTSPTGQIGRHVVRHLLNAGEALRLAGRHSRTIAARPAALTSSRPAGPGGSSGMSRTSTRSPAAESKAIAPPTPGPTPMIVCDML